MVDYYVGAATSSPRQKESEEIGEVWQWRGLRSQFRVKS
jgi:hypothetical protein